MMLFCSDYDGSHASVSDFYPEFATQIKAALTHYENFNTGWLNVRKQMQSFRVIAGKKRICVEVFSSMDEDIELVENAITAVTGLDDIDNVIRSAIIKRMPISDFLDSNVERFDALIWLAEHAPEEVQSSDCRTEECFARSPDADIAFNQIVSALKHCSDIAEKELDSRFTVMKAWLSYMLTGDDGSLHKLLDKCRVYKLLYE